MSDLRLVPVIDPLSGMTTYDIPITPAGDWSLVSGTDYLAQKILFFLLSAIGSHPTNPYWGSEIPAEIGLPAPDPADYQVILSECAAYFLAQQAAYPQTPLDEQLDHIGDVTVAADPVNIGRYLLHFTVFARSGTSSTTSTPL